MTILFLLGKNMCFWNDTSARPAFWPEDVPYGNIKRSNNESLCKIIHAYLNANDHGEAPSYRDRSPHGSPKTTTRVEVDVSDDLLSETDQSDIDLSSEPFFPFLQPENISHQDSQGINEPTPILANFNGEAVQTGVFAADVCLALATGVDPVTIRWIQNRMRTHLHECFLSEILTPFPTMERRLDRDLRPRLIHNLLSTFTIQLWCVCHLPSFAFRNMVECPKCLNWYHKPCG